LGGHDDREDEERGDDTARSIRGTATTRHSRIGNTMEVGHTDRDIVLSSENDDSAVAAMDERAPGARARETCSLSLTIAIQATSQRRWQGLAMSACT